MLPGRAGTGFVPRWATYRPRRRRKWPPEHCRQHGVAGLQAGPAAPVCSPVRVAPVELLARPWGRLLKQERGRFDKKWPRHREKRAPAVAAVGGRGGGGGRGAVLGPRTARRAHGRPELGTGGVPRSGARRRDARACASCSRVGAPQDHEIHDLGLVTARPSGSAAACARDAPPRGPRGAAPRAGVTYGPRGPCAWRRFGHFTRQRSPTCGWTTSTFWPSEGRPAHAAARRMRATRRHGPHGARRRAQSWRMGRECRARGVATAILRAGGREKGARPPITKKQGGK